MPFLSPTMLIYVVNSGAQLGIFEGRGFSRKKGQGRTLVGVKGAEPPESPEMLTFLRL